METISDFYALLSGKEFSIPLWEVTVFVFFVSICLLFGKHRLGLITTYCFVFYWGFITNLETFTNILGKVSWGMPLYIFSGCMMFIIAIIGFWVEDRN